MKLNRIVDKGMARIYVSMIRFAEQNPLKDDSFIRKVKRELRKWYKREISEEQLVHSDLDSYDSIITCPEIIQSYREAYKYYLNHYYSDWMPSQYDCTGQKKTYLRKVFKRNGRFCVWYHTIFDC